MKIFTTIWWYSSILHPLLSLAKSHCRKSNRFLQNLYTLCLSFLIEILSQVKYVLTRMLGNAHHDGRPLGWGGRVKTRVLLFCDLSTIIHWIKYMCAGVIAICNAIFHLTISCCVPGIFAKVSESLKFRCFGPPNILGRGPQTSDRIL